MSIELDLQILGIIERMLCLHMYIVLGIHPMQTSDSMCLLDARIHTCKDSQHNIQRRLEKHPNDHTLTAHRQTT